MSKWFISRAGKETLLRQSEEFSLHDSMKFDDGLELGVTEDEKLSERLVYDFNDGAANNDSASESEDENSVSRNRNTIASNEGCQDSLRFDSCFESGNLARAVRVYGRKNLVTQRALGFMKDYVVPAEVDQEYDLTLNNDINTMGNIQWYYFRASFIKSDFAVSSVSYPLTVRFNIINMQKSDALYNYGMKPLVYSETAASGDNAGWVHGGFDICYYKNGRTELKKTETTKKKKKIVHKYSLSFSYTFDKPGTVYFAHSYPYTYTTLQQYLRDLSTRKSISLFYRRRELCQTLCGNHCDLVTITGPTDDATEMKERKAVIISARIHPGETNSSFMVQGIIDFLVSDSPEADALRKIFVFKIVPMLNPDGVIHGNYRCMMTRLLFDYILLTK